MNEQDRKKIVGVITKEIQTNGPIQIKVLTKTLSNYRIQRQKYTNLKPKRWIESEFPEFEIEGTHGNEIIVLANQNSNTQNNKQDKEELYVEKKFPLCQLVSNEADLKNENVKFGVIHTYEQPNVFIERAYLEQGDGFLLEKVNLDQVSIVPSNMTFQTNTYAYLVKYKVTGKEQKVFDGSCPIEVLHSFVKKNYVQISVEEDTIYIKQKKEGKSASVVQPVKKDKTTKEEEKQSLDFQVLDQLYDQGAYDSYLSSEILAQVDPCNLPMEYMEKAVNCAHRLLYPESKEVIVLNEFQKELIRNVSAVDFVKKWKKEEKFPTKIMEECGESSVASFEIPRDAGIVSKLLNKVGYVGGYNNNYVGIVNRLVACENKLVPHFYIIRMFVHPSRSSIQKCLNEYCQLVRTLKQSSYKVRIADIDKMYWFLEVIQVIHKYLLKDMEIPHNIRTNIVSVFVEYDKLPELITLIPLLDPDYSSNEWKLVDLYFHPETWTEKKFQKLYEENVSNQLLQRFLALLWERYKEDNELPLHFLRILAWVIQHDTDVSIDEILRYHIDNDFTKVNKLKMLSNSYEAICDEAKNDLNMYTLASYIALNPYNENYEEWDEIAKQNWGTYSQTYFAQIVKKYGELTGKNAEDYIKLFSIFQLDLQHYGKVQKLFAEWYVAKTMVRDYADIEYSEMLESLFANGAYEAYLQVYSIVEAKNEFLINGTRRIEQYSESLIHLQRYADAILYLQNNKYIDTKNKNDMLLKVVGENFRRNGISLNAYSIFGEHFTCQDAISILLGYLPNNHTAVTSLIALYCYTKEYHKALYLYSIFQAKAEKGFTRIYSQIRTTLSKYIGKVSDHYDAIQIAFESLTYDGLIEFLKWTQGIIIPDFQGYNPTHAFSYYFETLKSNPLSLDNWTAFLTHITKRIDLNAWMICVCETVLRKKIGYNGVMNSAVAIRNVMKKADVDALPENFLLYVCTYIMEYCDSEICNELVKLLKDENVVNKLVVNNIWYEQYDHIMAKFKTFCLDFYSKTSDTTYYEILTILGVRLQVSDLENLTQTNANKQYLFAQICKNYQQNQNIVETVNLLNNTQWKNLSTSDMEVLNILRMVFDDDESLLLDNGKQFSNEESVYRFKRDCIDILSTYPGKEGLYQFEKNCNNLAYKLRVYSYVFGAIFDEDIYDKYELRYDDLEDEQVYDAYLAFLKKAYFAQLERNTTYDFFYKKWRYLKLYIVEALQNITDPEQIDDSGIVNAMERYNHYDLVYDSAYVPFKKAILNFLQVTNWHMVEKQRFLVSLMTGKMGEYLKAYSNTLTSLSPNQKEVIRNVIAMLDYREVAYSFYSLFWNQIQSGAYEEVLEIAETVSIYAYDAISALKEEPDKNKALKVFRDIAVAEKPSICVNKVIKMDETVFQKFAKIVMPLMCSRQFIFQIYGRLRISIIQYTKATFSEKYRGLAEYLNSRNVTDAMTVYYYLCALQACMRKNRKEAQEIIRQHDINKGIPMSWKGEAQQISRYASEQSMKFIPERIYMDNSQEEERKEIRFTFVQRLQQFFGVERTALTLEAAMELYEKYKGNDTNTLEKIKMGVAILLNYPKVENEKRNEDLLPSKHVITLEVGLDALLPEVNLSVEDRVLILTELFVGRRLYTKKVYKDSMNRLNEHFSNALKRNFSIQTWVRYADVIEEFLIESRSILDFKELKERILVPCKQILAPECSYEQRYEKLSDLREDFAQLESLYARNVREAIGAECRRMEEGIRLKIAIVNQNDAITDGYVYFQIENIGRRTVSLQDHISIIFKQENQPQDEVQVEGITNLQSGCLTGGKVKLSKVSPNKEIQVSLSIQVASVKGKGDLVSQVTQTLKVVEAQERFIIPEDARYNVSSAVSETEMLFGRDNLKERLTRSIPSGVTVIYGPSRIGKTSLLNWVRNDLATTQGNVITILFGGEGGLGKEKDYTENFVNHKLPIPYEDDYKMTEYLLIDTIVQSIEKMTRRLRKPTNQKIPEGLLKEMVQILKDVGRDVSDRYYEINEMLKEANLELWILLDEFQQVVERWKPKLSCDFVTICKMLSYSGADSLKNIKLVICGSDDLLRHMVLEDNSVWRQACPKESRIPVEALESEPFFEMIEQDNAIQNTNIRYSDSAKSALYAYTGGIALYGKEICNTVIEDITANSSDYKGRNTIYVSDIAQATQKLLNRQASELDTKAKEGIREIYDAVTKNLRKDTDMQYLLYMAQWLYTNPEKDGFPETIFTDRKLVHDVKKLKDSLAIAVARGIIKEKPYHEKPIYVFKTLFYYFAFLGNAKKNLDENMIFVQEQTEEKTEQKSDENPYTIERIGAYFENLTEASQSHLLGALTVGAKKGAVEKLKNVVAKIVHGDDIGGDKVVQINVQNVTNILNNLGTMGQNPSELLKGIQELPRLQEYLPHLLSDDPEKNADVYEENLSRGIEAYGAFLEEGIRNSEVAKESIEYWEILGVEEEEYEEFVSRYNVSAYFLESLKFTYHLDRLFMQEIVQEHASEIDYSPVTIMYCKLVESLLREYHTKVYSDNLGTFKTMIGRPENRRSKYTWEEVNGLPEQQKQFLTIGSFVTPLYKDWVLKKLATRTDQPIAQWELHKEMIIEVKNIRNPSAHGSKEHKISLEEKNEITKRLLDDKGLMRLIEIVSI